MKILYFAGFGGIKSSETFQNILEKYPDSIFIKYDNINANRAFEQIEVQLSCLSIVNHIIVGQSLGGFWAEYFANKYNCSLVLINPSLKPYESLVKYNLEEADLESYRKYKISKNSQSKVSLIVSKYDQTVNPDYAIFRYKGVTDIKYIDSDHKLNEFDTLFAEIKIRIENDF